MLFPEKSVIITPLSERRVSTSVVHRLPKPRRRVRFPYPAPYQSLRNQTVSEAFLNFSSDFTFASDSCGTLWKLEHWGKREGCLPWQAPLQDIFLLLFDTTTPPSPKRVDVNAILLAGLCTGKLSRENQVVLDRTRDTQNRHYVRNG